MNLHTFSSAGALGMMTGARMNKNTVIGLLLAVIVYLLLYRDDPNSKPVYGDTGLPRNCRAYVQTVINDYRAHKYGADESFNGLERNCGLYGYSWGLR